MSDSIIIGIGNTYRGDDAAGWKVIDRLEGKVKGIELKKIRGDIVELVELFSKHKSVYLVDASLSSGKTGRWQRIDIHRESIPEENGQTSTHGLGISQAISLAKNLDLLPTQLIVYAISGDNFNMHEGVSPEVAQSIENVSEEILKELAKENSPF